MPNPDFIIIGASRSGTSSLHAYLRQHPKIHMPPEKEVHFFDFQYGKGLDWYREKFKTEFINGEASPFYMPSAVCAARVKTCLPDVKIIALCREPGARAYSHYWFNKVRSEDDKPFLQAIQLEQRRLRGASKNTVTWRRYSYLARGRYAEQLERWKDFDLMVIKSEDLFANPQSIVGGVYAWLGLEPYTFKVKVHRNQSYPPMGQQARNWLTGYFEPFNKQLKDDWGIEWHG